MTQGYKMLDLELVFEYILLPMDPTNTVMDMICMYLI